MFPVFKRRRFLKVAALILGVAALDYVLEIVVPFVQARGIAFENAYVYYVCGSDFIRVTDSSHGVYSVAEYRESFSFSYSLGTYFCNAEGRDWDMRLVDESNLYDERSNQWFWGTSI